MFFKCWPPFLSGHEHTTWTMVPFHWNVVLKGSSYHVYVQRPEGSSTKSRVANSPRGAESVAVANFECEAEHAARVIGLPMTGFSVIQTSFQTMTEFEEYHIIHVEATGLIRIMSLVPVSKIQPGYDSSLPKVTNLFPRSSRNFCPHRTYTYTLRP